MCSDIRMTFLLLWRSYDLFVPLTLTWPQWPWYTNSTKILSRSTCTPKMFSRSMFLKARAQTGQRHTHRHVQSNALQCTFTDGKIQEKYKNSSRSKVKWHWNLITCRGHHNIFLSSCTNVWSVVFQFSHRRTEKRTDIIHRKKYLFCWHTGRNDFLEWEYKIHACK